MTIGTPQPHRGGYAIVEWAIAFAFALLILCAIFAEVASLFEIFIVTVAAFILWRLVNFLAGDRHGRH